MPNEITLGVSVAIAKGINKDSLSFSQQFTQTGTDGNAYTLTVTDAGWTALAKANIGSLGLMVIRNLSSTTADIVYVTRDGGVTEHEELLPGAWILTWLRSSATIANVGVKAAAGKTVLVRVWLWEQ